MGSLMQRLHYKVSLGAPYQESIMENYGPVLRNFLVFHPHGAAKVSTHGAQTRKSLCCLAMLYPIVGCMMALVRVDYSLRILGSVDVRCLSGWTITL